MMRRCLQVKLRLLQERVTNLTNWIVIADSDEFYEYGPLGSNVQVGFQPRSSTKRFWGSFVICLLKQGCSVQCSGVAFCGRVSHRVCVAVVFISQAWKNIRLDWMMCLGIVVQNYVHYLEVSGATFGRGLLADRWGSCDGCIAACHVGWTS